VLLARGTREAKPVVAQANPWLLKNDDGATSAAGADRDNAAQGGSSQPPARVEAAQGLHRGAQNLGGPGIV